MFPKLDNQKQSRRKLLGQSEDVEFWEECAMEVNREGAGWGWSLKNLTQAVCHSLEVWKRYKEMLCFHILGISNFKSYLSFQIQVLINRQERILP